MKIKRVNYMKTYIVSGYYKLLLRTQTIEAESKGEAIEKYEQMIEEGIDLQIEDQYQDNEPYLRAEEDK